MDAAKLLPSQDDLAKIIEARHGNPHSVLGMHPCRERNSVVVRVYDPLAVSVSLHDDKGAAHQMQQIDPRGLFAVEFPDRDSCFSYEIERTFKDGGSFRAADPYCFLPSIGEMDQYLFNKGELQRVYDIMGAHFRKYGNITGVSFAVWAPSAQRVSVVGDFNCWDGRRHTMRLVGSSGIWEIFIPGIKEGDIYKFEVRTANGDIFLKLDPYAYQTELRPKSAAVVSSPKPFEWTDAAWIEKRGQASSISGPMSIYEVHIGSWCGPGLRELDRKNEDDFHSYKEIAHALADYVVEMGFTHIELLPVAEHPLDQSWGYQITGYYAPTARHGAPADFAYFVDHMHSRGIGVIMDWVPAHFPKDAYSLGRFDGTALYEHLDPKQGEHCDWGTYIFNFGRNEVRNFLIGNALYWFDKFHIDGLRVDAVASMLYLDYSRSHGQWIPNKYGGRENIDAVNMLRRLNELTHQLFPGTMMIAEESTAWAGVSRPVHSGGLGFTYKWNMGWMHDTLEYFKKDPIFRSYHHDKLTFSIWYAFTENFVLPLSHDEVVHGKCSLVDKMSGDYWQKFANLRLMFAYMFTHPGKKLIFMGGEFGQWEEWDCKQSLKWLLLKYPIHSGLSRMMKDLNALYRKTPSLWEADFTNDGFEWVDLSDFRQSVLSYMRWDKGRKTPVLVVLNCTPVVRNNYRIGVPFGGVWNELFNSDSSFYGGSGVGNKGAVTAQQVGFHSHPWSLDLTLPPLGALVFRQEKK